jgi:hypothetical protein
VLDLEQLRNPVCERRPRRADAPPASTSAWANASDERTVAQIELRPGQSGFETALRVAYGLAADGRSMKNGLPRNPLHTALPFDWGKGRLPGAHAVLEPVFRLLARVARWTGTDRRLIEQYD